MFIGHFDASYVNGNYKFVIDKSKFKDLTLISGLGLDSLPGSTARNSTCCLPDVNIVPVMVFRHRRHNYYWKSGDLPSAVYQ